MEEVGEPKGNPDENDDVVAVEWEELFLKENASVLRKLVESGLGLRTKGEAEDEEEDEGVAIFVLKEDGGEADEKIEDERAGMVGVGAGVRRAVVVVVAVAVVVVIVAVVVLVVEVSTVAAFLSVRGEEEEEEVGVEVENLDNAGDKAPPRRGLDGADSGCCSWREWG